MEQVSSPDSLLKSISHDQYQVVGPNSDDKVPCVSYLFSSDNVQSTVLSFSSICLIEYGKG